MYRPDQIQMCLVRPVCHARGALSLVVQTPVRCSDPFMIIVYLKALISIGDQCLDQLTLLVRK